MAIETETLYKLMIMHMLNKVEFPLTNSQIAQFFLENEYTNYFAVQKAINELIEDGFVFSNVNRNTSYYHLSSEDTKDDGKEKRTAQAGSFVEDPTQLFHYASVC